MTAPKVSVCMITYNQERYIAQAVESVLMQRTDFEFEIVVGEDCSTDGTRAVLQRLAEQSTGILRLAIPPQNLGPNRNFAQALAQCRGRYVAMLEGDDYWTSPHKLQKQVAALDARPDWAMCFHPAEIVYDDGRPPGRWPDQWDKPEATLVDMFERNLIPTNAAMFRRGLFDDFPSWFFEQTMGDWTLHMLNAAHGNIGFLPETMSVYRIHADGLWSSMPRPQQMRAMLKMLSAVDRHFGGKFSEPIDRCRFDILDHAVSGADEAKAACERLRDENRSLQMQCDFLQMKCDSMSRSLAFKAVRELTRPFRDLRNFVIGRRAARRTASAPAPLSGETTLTYPNGRDSDEQCAA